MDAGLLLSILEGSRDRLTGEERSFPVFDWLFRKELVVLMWEGNLPEILLHDCDYALYHKIPYFVALHVEIRHASCIGNSKVSLNTIMF